MTAASGFLPVFIGACPRSGTTFLADRLGALLGARVRPESQFKRRVLAALAEGDRARAVATLDCDPGYRLWTDRPSKGELMGCSDAAEFFARLVFPNGPGPGEAPIWIDHTPINFEDFLALRDTLPNARFISLVRDGRAVFASVRGLEWGPKNPIHAAQWWAARTAPGLAAGLSTPDICRNVRFEDLVREDLAAWTDLVRFVTGDGQREVKRADLTLEGNFTLPEFTRHQHRLVGSAPSAARAEAWRKTLTPREVEIFECNAGALLDTLGYARDYRFPRFADRQEMLRMGEWPVRITMQPLKKFRLARRWRRVADPSGGAWR